MAPPFARVVTARLYRDFNFTGLRRSFFLAVMITQFATVLVDAMEWETAIEVACCTKHAGYERDASRVASALKASGIVGKVIYFKRVSGVDAVTEDSRNASRFGIFVDTADATKARTIVAQQIAKGVRVSRCAPGHKQHD